MPNSRQLPEWKALSTHLSTVHTLHLFWMFTLSLYCLLSFHSISRAVWKQLTLNYKQFFSVQPNYHKSQVWNVLFKNNKTAWILTIFNKVIVYRRGTSQLQTLYISTALHWVSSIHCLLKELRHHDLGKIPLILMFRMTTTHKQPTTTAFISTLLWQTESYLLTI